MKHTYLLTDTSVREKIQLMQRYVDLPDGVSFDWTDSALCFRAVCAGEVEVTLRFEVLCEKQTLKNQYMSIFVDGVYREIVLADLKENETVTMRFTVEGEPAEHEIWVVRQLERQYGAAVLISFAFDGELLCRPEAETLIEFVGDSVTCAGASSKVHDENGTNSYAFLTAKALGTDWRMVSNGGWGLTYNSGGETGVDACWRDSYVFENRHRDTNRPYRCLRQADVVCIYLGCNDCHSKRQGTSHFTMDDFAEDGKKLIATIKEYQPNALFVWLIGGISYAYKEGAFKCMNDLGGEEAGYYVADLGGEYHSGGCWHPSETEHVKMAEALIAWFNEKKLF